MIDNQIVVHIFFHSADDNMHFTQKYLLSSCLMIFQLVVISTVEENMNNNLIIVAEDDDDIAAILTGYLNHDDGDISFLS
jgi:hypothetical protein